MKKEIPLNKTNRLINCGQVILVSSHSKGKNNIITLAWHMPISHKPPLLGISIANSHLSYDMIQESKEFIVNIPSMNLLSLVVYCGSNSGRNVDKFKENNIQPAKASKLANTPVIEECIGHIECRVKNSIETGDHTVFIGEPVYAAAKEELFDEVWIVDKAKLITHLGGKNFSSPTKITTV